MGDIVKSHTLRTIREEFDEYLLQDGNILRMKDVIVSFGFPDKEVKFDSAGKAMTKAFIQFQQVLGVVPTADVDTSNLKIQAIPITEKDRINELEFTSKKNSLNLYETDEVLIILRSKLNYVWTTPYKDKTDIPIYSINSSSAVEARHKGSIAIMKDTT